VEGDGEYGTGRKRVRKGRETHKIPGRWMWLGSREPTGTISSASTMVILAERAIAPEKFWAA
jgi:hypothetical protein